MGEGWGEGAAKRTISKVAVRVRQAHFDLGYQRSVEPSSALRAPAPGGRRTNPASEVSVNAASKLSRGSFLKTSALAGGGLVIGFAVPVAKRFAIAQEAEPA